MNHLIDTAIKLPQIFKEHPFIIGLLLVAFIDFDIFLGVLCFLLVVA